jgi:hypothetical protein
MKIKNYRQFNEEISKEKLQTLATAGLIGLGGYGAYQMYQKEGSGELVKEISTTKFDASVDIAVRLGVDPR